MSAFYLARLQKTEATILLLDDVIAKALSLDTGAIHIYSLDDGQTKESVTKRSVGPLHALLNKLINDHETFSEKCGLVSNIAQVVNFG